MSVLLVRVDQRLVHGQVTVGWLPSLRAERLLVADDVLATEAWEREMVLSAAPPGTAVEILGIDDAAVRLGAEIPERAILLLRSPQAALALVRREAPIREINLGGLHFREGSRRFLDYLYVTREDVEALHELDRRCVRLVAQDLPASRRVDLNEALAKERLDYDRLPAGGP